MKNSSWWTLGLTLGAVVIIGVSYLSYLSFRSVLGTSSSNPAGVIAVCTEEAKICADGSAVGRGGPNCEFAACPGVKSGTKECVRGGCSGQICEEAGTGTITTCEYSAVYGCYQQAECTEQLSGECGFTQTPALQQCLAAANAEDVNSTQGEQFSGKIESVNTGCFSDGVCSVTISGRVVELIVGSRALGEVKVGQLLGVESIGDLEALIGTSADVYALRKNAKLYTLYGSSGYYVQVKK